MASLAPCSTHAAQHHGTASTRASLAAQRCADHGDMRSSNRHAAKDERDIRNGPPLVDIRSLRYPNNPIPNPTRTHRARPGRLLAIDPHPLPSLRLRSAASSMRCR